MKCLQKTVSICVLSISSISFAGPSPKPFVKVPDLSCPDEISVAPDQKLNKTPKGWRKFVDKENFRTFLENVNFYTDTPEKLGMLRGDDDGVADLTPKTQDSWITCVYGHTIVQLTKKIPKKYDACRAIFTSKEDREKNHLLGVLQYVECR